MGTRRRRVSVIRIRSKPVKWDDLRMEFISKCTADTISNAAQALINGHLVAFPTETVYGLGADATNKEAVSRIYSVKGRPIGHPLIVHISSINKMEDWASDIPDYAIKLAREFWPGPMTLILPRTDLAKDYITGGQNNVGLRVPNQPIALALLKKFEDFGGQGVAAPSANRFGAISPTLAEAVTEEIGDYLEINDLVIDGGLSRIGLESTIIDCTSSEPIILRPGAIIEENIQSISGIKIGKKRRFTDIHASGMLKSHYAPRAEVNINVNPNPGDGFIALSNIPTPYGAVRLGSPENTEQFARFIYIFLRLGDKKKLRKISVVLPVQGELSEAIADRIRKASHR